MGNENIGFETNGNIDNSNNTVLYDKFLVSTNTIRDLINNAKKVANYVGTRVITQVVGIKLDNLGITVNASNGLYCFEQTNASRKYSDNLKVCIDIKEISDLLSGVDFEEIELSIDEQTNALVVFIDEINAEYKFGQRDDISTGMPIDLSLSFPIAYDDMIDVDFEKINTAIANSKPLRDKPQIKPEFRGVLFADMVVAAESTVIFIQQNQEILKTQRFFIDSDFCNLISSIGFDPQRFRMGFTSDPNGEIIAITMADGNLMVCGKTATNCGIPNEIGSKFWATNPDKSVYVNSKKLVNAFKRLSFSHNANRDDVAIFDFQEDHIAITNNGGINKDGVIGTNNTGFVGKIPLPFTVFRSIISTIKSDTIRIYQDAGLDKCVCLEIDDFKWVIGTMTSDND